jgi:hypothetical protein
MFSTLPAPHRWAGGSDVARATFVECNLLRILSGRIRGNSELRRLWTEELKAMSPRRNQEEHADRVCFLERILERLGDDASPRKLSTPKIVRDTVRLEFTRALEVLRANDALYAIPVRK